MKLWHSALPVAAMFRATVVAALLVGCTAEPSADIVVSVDATGTIGTIGTRLGTQFVWPGSLDRAEGTRARFDALAAPLVRINATTFGPAPVLPAGIVRGDWDFASLDSIVSDIRGAGGQVVLAVAYAPEWLWNCDTGAVRDTTFAEFGDYMARLVAYYNRGSLLAENGRQIVNPAGTANRIDYWELWNEPDQLKGCPPAGNRISPAAYVAMWNGTVPRMLAIDPTIKLIGPAVAQAATTSVPDYIPALMESAVRKPDAISFHGYGGWLNSQTDRFLFDGANGRFGLEAIVRGVASVKALAPGIPIWITEVNVNSAWDHEDVTGRPWSAFGAAWGASAFRRLALAGADVVFQYQFAHPDLRQFSLVDARTGVPLLAYWRDYYLARYFPPGSLLLASSSNRAGVESLAVRPPGSSDVHVLVVNRQVDSESAVGGDGRGAVVRVSVTNVPRSRGVTVRMIDAATPLDTGPSAVRLPKEDAVMLTFSGYGAALLELVGES